VKTIHESEPDGAKGANLYKDEAGEKRVGPGDFIRVPGGHKHWSGRDKKEGYFSWACIAASISLSSVALSSPFVRYPLTPIFRAISANVSVL
jgi:hypothetical protein